MAREKPLSRGRLHEILDLYEPGVRMEMKGGYDVGVYFAFAAKALQALPADAVAGGRRVRRWGFCSESLAIGPHERYGRDGAARGIASFFARCERRRAVFARWIAEHEKGRADQAGAAP